MRLINLLSLILLFTIQNIYGQSTDRITIGNQELFASGGNVAWINFARDIGPGNTRLDLFEEMFVEMNEHGGNTFRLWLHTNGASTPEFSGTGSDAEVIGPGEGTIDDLRDILDLAYFHNISLVLCLWSFDMLQTHQTGVDGPRNIALLTEDDKLQAYIDNALIPMADSLKGHPAILAWEIFNEPEGMTEEFGWSTERVTMADVQRFVNRTVSAIRQTDPNALITNGSWSFHASSDIFTGNPDYKNYYRDDRLIEAGGEEDGILDFYTVHYYAWGGTALSPFHNDVDHWDLDKPVAITEFYVQTTIGIPYDELFTTLYEGGYAGALGWQWYDKYANREGLTHNWPNALENMQIMWDLHREDVELLLPGLRGRFTAFPEGIEEGGTSTLSWIVRGEPVSVTLNNNPVEPEDSLEVSPEETTTYILSAEDAEGDTKEWQVTVTVLDPMQVNRALGKPVYASSVQDEVAGENLPAHHVNDGNPNTRWSSKWQDDEWIFIDLEASYAVHEVVVNWEAAYGESYNIDFSFDGVNWETIYEEREGQGGIDSIAINPTVDTRFVRMHGLERATEWGFSIYEFEIYGLPSDIQPPQITITSPIENAFLEARLPVTIETQVTTGSFDIQQVDFYIDNDLVGTVNEEPYQYIWEDPEEGSYVLSAIVIDEEFEVHSFPRDVLISPEADSIRFEAEDALLTGDVEVISSASASGGAYVQMEDAADAHSTLTWDEIEINDTGYYGLRIGYRLPHGEKGQHIYVNDEMVYEEVMFTGPANEWLTMDLTVELQSGTNSIMIEGFWGWMDFDYIEIRGQNLPPVSVDKRDEIVRVYELYQNYPNPFNPSTTIRYQLAEQSHVALTVYDVTGKKVRALVDDTQQAGFHKVVFDAGNLSSGVYFYRIQAGDYTATNRMMFIK